MEARVEKMDSQRFAREEGEDSKNEIDPTIYRLFKKMMVEILSEQAEASFGRAPTTEKAHVTFPMSKQSDSSARSSKASKGNGEDTQGNQSSNSEESADQKGKFGMTQDKPLPSTQHKGKGKEKPKRKDWSRDRDFTPLDEPLDKVLEYMLTKD